jgi:hypothetical protein
MIANQDAAEIAKLETIIVPHAFAIMDIGSVEVGQSFPRRSTLDRQAVRWADTRQHSITFARTQPERRKH